MKPGLCPQRQHALPGLSLTVRPASHHATSGTEAGPAKTRRHISRSAFSAQHMPGTQERETGTRRQKARKRAAACTAAALGLS
ncbi:conserved domain protein [Prevotella denticola CRIS 18C-A]|uniref:Conserved domain protein n=1 Tax=Prevotella denticola CRIS 18C-A TaxID=944557 RepID=F0H7C2_9BACT|nr:conserved domain protein [Prevotella denticola CRIS 18C-A]